MPRLKCKRCGNVFEYEYHPLDSVIHLGPIRMIRCPVCGKSSFFNFLSSVKDPVTWSQEKKQENLAKPRLSEEEQEENRIEESKYEKA